MTAIRCAWERRQARRRADRELWLADQVRRSNRQAMRGAR